MALGRWRSLFSFYYTGELEFSHLRSEKAAPNLPFSCSPKSMYSLAKSVRASPALFRRSLIADSCHWKKWSLSHTSISSEKRFRCRTLSRNCFRPLLHRESSSDGVAGQASLSTTIFYSDDKILNMETDLLFDKFENEATSEEIQRHIRAMSRGDAVFRAKTLGFIYHKLSTRKRHNLLPSARVEPQGVPESPRVPPPIPGEPETKVICLRVHVSTVSELLQGLYCPAAACNVRGPMGNRRRLLTRCRVCETLREAVGSRCRGCNTLFAQ